MSIFIKNALTYESLRTTQLSTTWLMLGKRYSDITVKKPIFKIVRASERLHMALALICFFFIGDFGHVIAYRTHENVHWLIATYTIWNLIVFVIFFYRSVASARICE